LIEPISGLDTKKPKDLKFRLGHLEPPTPLPERAGSPAAIHCDITGAADFIAGIGFVRISCQR